jgi:hypothetical protein
MEFLQRLPLPRRLSSRVWLISLPSALLSFERRQRVPKMPIGNLRFLGLPLVAAGVGIVVWARRRPGATIAYHGPLDHLARTPSTIGGIIALTGAALLLRSVALACHSVGLAFAAGSDVIAIDEPDIPGFVGRKRRDTGPV